MASMAKCAALGAQGGWWEGLVKDQDRDAARSLWERLVMNGAKLRMLKDFMTKNVQLVLEKAQPE